MKIISLLAFLFHYQLYTCVAEEQSPSLVQSDHISLKQEGVGRNSAADRFVGCFKDGRNPRDLPNRKIPATWDYAKTDSWRGMFPELCMMLCAEEQFPYAGVQNGRECYCSDKDWSPGSPRYGKQRRSKCNRPCQHHVMIDCGGAWHNSVYKVELPYKVKSYEMLDVVYTPFKKMIEVEPDKPEVMSSTQVINYGDEEQEMSEEITAVHTSSISVSSTHDFTLGISVTWESNMFFGVGGIGTSVGVSLEYGFSTTTGETKEESHEDTSAFTITVPPRSQCTVKLTGKRKESRFMYNGTLVTHYVQDDDDYEKKEPKREPVGGILDATATTNVQIKYERCTDICPPEKKSANCRYVKKCKVEEDCGDGFECQCSRDCGMTCKREKPVHPCYQDTPVCKNGGTCKVVEVESGESRYADTKKVKSGKGASPIPDDPEYKCDCVGVWQGKHCSWSYDLFAAGADSPGTVRRCKSGWKVDAGLLGTEWYETEVECQEGEQCIRLEGELITRGPIHHYHIIYRCYPRDNCQTMVDENCMPIALDSTQSSGHNLMIQMMTCKGICCDTDNCNAMQLAGGVAPPTAATTRPTTAATTTTSSTTTATGSTAATTATTRGSTAATTDTIRGSTAATTATIRGSTAATTATIRGSTAATTATTTTTTTGSTAATTTLARVVVVAVVVGLVVVVVVVSSFLLRKKEPPAPKLEVTITLIAHWDDAYDDPESEGYKALIRKFKNMIKRWMGWTDENVPPTTTWVIKKGSVIAVADMEMEDEAAVDEGLKKIEEVDVSSEPDVSSLTAKKITASQSPNVTQPTRPSGGNSVHGSPRKTV